MPFQPGESGNPSGSHRRKPFFDALDRAIVQEDGKRVREAAEHLLTKASAGEPWAIEMLAERLDGKVAQAVTGAEGGALVVQVIRFADPDSR